VGAVNWIAVILGANLAVALGMVWHGPLFRTGRPLLEGMGADGADKEKGAPIRNYGIVVVVMLIAATMMGHNFARLGAAHLAGKPWLYWMMSGGLAVAFVIPAVCLGALRQGVARRMILIDCGYWLAAYLAMGTVFWAMG
jgi:Protein of unknown function (DUF1761)